MGITPTNQAVKRIFDLCFSVAMIIVLLPLWVLIGVMTFIAFGRPILYISPRVGKNQCEFNMLKFRTMRNDSDRHGNPLSDEKRLTPFGRFIRRTSVDELPQLVNIVRGEMSLIGPRPILLKEADMVPEEYRKRYLVRPGLSGLAVVKFMGGWRSWEEKLAFDMEYINRYNILLDVKIFLVTFWVLISCFIKNKTGLTRGAEERMRQGGD